MIAGTVESPDSHMTMAVVSMSWQRKIAKMFCVFYQAFPLTILLVGVLAFSTCPFPECGYCLEPQVRTAPGIDFDLIASYGQVSIGVFLTNSPNVL